MNTELINRITNKDNKILLQIINTDGTITNEYVKSISVISKKLNIPYSTLINLYYICTNKGGGKNKNIKKKYIHNKYIELLKHIRIFDGYPTSDDYNDFLNNLLSTDLKTI